MSNVIWHETKMTSNNTPSPLVASASSVYPSTVAAWKAFNGTTSDNQDAWASTSGVTDAYVILDYGKEYVIDRVKITSVNGAVTFGTKNFEVFGSNNNTEWTLLSSELNIPVWGKAEAREFIFNKKGNFRYLKLRTWGTYQTVENYVGIGDIQYGSDIDKKLAIKNYVTNKHYSMSDNTIIHLPDNSTKNMILHGIEQGKEIQLDVPFDKHTYINDKPVASVSGKVFTQDIGIINTLNIRENREEKSIVTTWHETKMTSNNTPTPLVASANSIYSSTYDAFMAFNGGANITGDGWAAAIGTTDAYLTLDYGSSREINCVKIQYMNNNDITFAPKNIIISCSSNDNDWKDIGNFTNLSFAQNEIKIFNLQSNISRFLRIRMSMSNGANYIAIGEITFGKRSEKEVK
ncbi:discoidin domain-containing protein [Lysinibacillus sp. NPDC048646]|uniref:discoidin domain-containing protein n=1 Tax=Lysinibacillus sp. NPDC048646 TaxID=3390574 RepID=UPI003CFE5F89